MYDFFLFTKMDTPPNNSPPKVNYSTPIKTNKNVRLQPPTYYKCLLCDKENLKSFDKVKLFENVHIQSFASYV